MEICQMTAQVDRRIRTSTRRTPASVSGLVGLLALLVLGAIQGGVAMVVDPLQPLGMPTSFLEATPIDTYFLPGLFLLAIAVASLITILGLTLDWRWDWAAGIEEAVGYRWPWMGGLATGSVLLVFEILELFMVPFHPIMHPLLIAGSLAIIWLTVTPTTRAHLSVEATR
jgi:hypothetical protein